MPRAYLCTASATCIASSRVGTSTRPAGVPARGVAGLVDPLQHRQRERRGLAGAGRGLPEQVAPFEEQRNGLALDRRGFFIAEGGDRRDHRLRKAEGGEAGLARDEFWLRQRNW